MITRREQRLAEERRRKEQEAAARAETRAEEQRLHALSEALLNASADGDDALVQALCGAWNLVRHWTEATP